MSIQDDIMICYQNDIFSQFINESHVFFFLFTSQIHRCLMKYIHFSMTFILLSAIVRQMWPCQFVFHSKHLYLKFNFLRVQRLISFVNINQKKVSWPTENSKSCHHFRQIPDNSKNVPTETLSISIRNTILTKHLSK